MLSIDDRRVGTKRSRCGLSELSCKSIHAGEMLFHFFLFCLLHSFIPASVNCSRSQYPVSFWLCNSQRPKWELKHSSDSGHCSHLKSRRRQQLIRVFRRSSKMYQENCGDTFEWDVVGQLQWGHCHWFEVRWRCCELWTRKLCLPLHNTLTDSASLEPLKWSFILKLWQQKSFHTWCRSGQSELCDSGRWEMNSRGSSEKHLKCNFTFSSEWNGVCY